RDRSEVEFMRHYTYLYLRSAVNTTERESSAQAADMDAEFTARTEFLARELAAIDPAVLARYVADEPRLAAYRPAIEMARRSQPHFLALDTEQALDTLSPVVRDWQYDLYDTLIGRTTFGTVTTHDATLDVRRQRTAIAADPERAVRRTGFERYYAAFASHRDL